MTGKHEKIARLVDREALKMFEYQNDTVSRTIFNKLIPSTITQVIGGERGQLEALVMA